MIKAVVLGCGPAGLMAAHACSLAGCDTHIYSIKHRSHIGGAQYIHEQIPGLTGAPDGDVMFAKWGTKEGYAKKVYGDSRTPVSWDMWEHGTSRPAWSMQRIYGTLWEMYHSAIVNVSLDSRALEEIFRREHADIHITSVPLPTICSHDQHFFESVQMYIKLDYPPKIPENTIIYNGVPDSEWSRASNLFGHRSSEYSRFPGGDNVIEGYKPTRHNCDCHPDWLRVGRFGKWQRGVLVHHAFKDVQLALQQMQ